MSKTKQENRPVAYVWSGELKLFQKKFPKLFWKPTPHIADLRKILQEESKNKNSSIALINIPIVTIPHMGQRDWILPFENYFSDNELARYLPLALRLLTQDGHLYGIPEDINPFGFFYNQQHQLSEEIGPPTTWDELLKTLAYLHDSHKRQGLQIELNSRYNNYGLIWSLFHSNGIESRSFDVNFPYHQKKIKDVFEFMIKLHELKNVIPENSLKTYSRSDTIENQKVNPLFYLGWLKGLPSMMRSPNQTLLLPFPKGNPEGQTAFPVSGSAWVIPKSSQYRDIGVKTILGMHKGSFAKSNELKGNISFPALKAFWQDKEILKKHPVLHSATVLLDPDTKVTQDFFQNNIIHLASSLRNGLLQNLTSEQWIQRLQSSIPGENLNLKNSALHKAVKFIGERIGDLINSEEISDHVSLSQNHLNFLFKKDLGCTCWDYVIQLRMERAKELILNTQFSIKEISYQMGFKKASSFTRSFQKHFGCNPTTFRNDAVFP